MVVVTGASGHVGGNLVRALLAAGHTVRALIRSDTRALEGLDAEVRRGDLTDPGFTREAIRGAEIVYHLASEISLLGNARGQIEALNVNGVRNVIAACRANGVRRLVHFSSIHALVDRPRTTPMDESRALVTGPAHSAYDRSKAEGERLVREAVQAGLDAVILNPTGILGPLDFKPSHLGEVVRAMARGGMRLLVDGGFDWVDVRDVAQAAVTAAERAPDIITDSREQRETLARVVLQRLRQELLIGDLACQPCGFVPQAAPGLVRVPCHQVPAPAPHAGGIARQPHQDRFEEQVREAAVVRCLRPEARLTKHREGRSRPPGIEQAHGTACGKVDLRIRAQPPRLPAQLRFLSQRQQRQCALPALIGETVHDSLRSGARSIQLAEKYPRQRSVSSCVARYAKRSVANRRQVISSWSFSRNSRPPTLPTPTTNAAASQNTRRLRRYHRWNASSGLSRCALTARPAW